LTQNDFEIEWIDRGRESRCPPNPAYPDGIDVSCAPRDAKQICLVQLPYPAPRCGLFAIRCKICHMTVAVTTAGRPDDPRTVQIACLSQERGS
jgi:hypothetical protein